MFSLYRCCTLRFDGGQIRAMKSLIIPVDCAVCCGLHGQSGFQLIVTLNCSNLFAESLAIKLLWIMFLHVLTHFRSLLCFSINKNPNPTMLRCVTVGLSGLDHCLAERWNGLLFCRKCIFFMTMLYILLYVSYRMNSGLALVCRKNILFVASCRLIRIFVRLAGILSRYV